MSTCPSCGAAADGYQGDPGSNYYVCGSNTEARAHQSDLCFARQRIRDVRDIVTTDSETKEQLQE